MPEDRYWRRFVSALHEAPIAHAPSMADTQVVDVGASLDRLVALEERYRSLIEGLPVVTFVAGWDGGRRIHYVSPQVEAVLGFVQGDWLEGGRLWSERLHPEDRARALEEVGAAFCADRALQSEYRLRDSDGRVVWVREQTGTPIRVSDDHHLTHGVLLDVTERRSVEAALARERARADDYRSRLDALAGDGSPTPTLADPVTGLLTRPAIEERVARAVEEARETGDEIALLCVDLDGFRLVNESLGLEAGDELLGEVGERLRRLLGPADALARGGSDDFLLMLAGLASGTGADAGEGAAHRVGDVLGAPVVVAGSDLVLTAAVGASVFPTDAREPEALMRHADAAMQSAREEGPGEFALYSGGTIEARMQLTETARLRRAIAGGELVVHYQPIFALPGGEVAHLEALVRWERDSRLVPPLEFVPLAEEAGLIESLGRWVLEDVLDQVAAWVTEGRDPRVSFNVSPRQLRRPDFARSVSAALAQRALDASRLYLEITESSAMRDSHAVEPLLVELREAGLKLAVDDFGMGYSSLDRLRELPFSILKIDRSFLARAPADRGCAGIVCAALELAEALDMEAVAEGVETEEQRAFLEERGCPLAQGFLLSRPLPAAEVASLLPVGTTAASKD